MFHPLSILILMKYGDKNGCSRNGSNEFLFEFGIGLHVVESKEDFENIKFYHPKLDYRDVLYSISSPESDINTPPPPEIILNWKTCYFNFVSKSSQPINDEEGEIVRSLDVISRSEYNPYNIKYWKSINGFNGHVVSLSPSPIDLSSSSLTHFINQISSLPQLRSLKLKLRCSESFEENLIINFGGLSQLNVLNLNFLYYSPFDVNIIQSISQLQYLRSFIFIDSSFSDGF